MYTESVKESGDGGNTNVASNRTLSMVIYIDILHVFVHKSQISIDSHSRGHDPLPEFKENSVLIISE